MIKKTTLENKQTKIIKNWKGSLLPRKKKRKVTKRYVVFSSTTHLRFRPYSEFLISDYWYQVRNIIIKRDKSRCKICLSSEKLQVHHTTYKNHFKEHLHLEDLITLCSKCHTDHHRSV